MYDSPNGTTQRSGWCLLMRPYTAVRYYNVNATPLIGVNKIGELVKLMHIVISSQVLFHNGSILHSQFNTQLLITVHNSSRILIHAQLPLVF
jgi:hypothetical protein